MQIPNPRAEYSWFRHAWFGTDYVCNYFDRLAASGRAYIPTVDVDLRSQASTNCVRCAVKVFHRDQG